MRSVYHLRKLGYKIRVLHHRRKRRKKLNPKGGRTEVQITAPNGAEMVGVANCYSTDNYNKKTGVKIALENAFVSWFKSRQATPLTKGTIVNDTRKEVTIGAFGSIANSNA